MKNIITVLAIVIAVISCVLAYRYNQDAARFRSQIDGERSSRITFEEDLENTKTQIASLQSELDRNKKKLESTEVLLQQTQEINTDLRSRLDQASVLKESLDSKIKELEQISGN